MQTYECIKTEEVKKAEILHSLDNVGVAYSSNATISEPVLLQKK